MPKIVKKIKQEILFLRCVVFNPINNFPSIVNQSLEVQKIKEWLCRYFNLSDEKVILINSGGNPHSEIFVFEQTDTKKIPEKIFVKRFAEPDLLEQEYISLQTFNQIRFHKNVTTPKVFARNKELNCMVTEYKTGESYFNTLMIYPYQYRTIKKQINEFCDTLHDLGKWSKQLHLQDEGKSIFTSTSSSIIKNDIQGITLRLEKLKKLRPGDFSFNYIKGIVSLIEKDADWILKNSAELSFVHGDFTLANMLYDNGKIIVIDFAMCNCGFPEDDIARIYLDLVNVEKFVFMGSIGNKDILRSSFLSGYGRRVELNNLTIVERFHFIKHLIINMYMYVINWGNKRYLNPVLCRLFYGYQKKILHSVIRKADTLNKKELIHE